MNIRGTLKFLLLKSEFCKRQGSVFLHIRLQKGGICINQIALDLCSTDIKCSYAPINISSKVKTKILKYFNPL